MLKNLKSKIFFALPQIFKIADSLVTYLLISESQKKKISLRRGKLLLSRKKEIFLYIIGKNI